MIWEVGPEHTRSWSCTTPRPEFKWQTFEMSCIGSFEIATAFTYGKWAPASRGCMHTHVIIQKHFKFNFNIVFSQRVMMNARALWAWHDALECLALIIRIFRSLLEVWACRGIPLILGVRAHSRNWSISDFSGSRSQNDAFLIQSQNSNSLISYCSCNGFVQNRRVLPSDEDIVAQSTALLYCPGAVIEIAASFRC